MIDCEVCGAKHATCTNLRNTIVSVALCEKHLLELDRWMHSDEKAIRLLITLMSLGMEYEMTKNTTSAPYSTAQSFSEKITKANIELYQKILLYIQEMKKEYEVKKKKETFDIIHKDSREGKK